MWRVRDRATFQALGRTPARAIGPVRLRTVPADPGPPRVAYAIGRAAGGAVARNRLRRRLRAAVRSHAELLEPDTAYLFGASRSASSMTSSALSTAVGALLSGRTTR